MTLETFSVREDRMPEYKRYNLTLRVVDASARDKFRMLSRPESFFEIRPNRSPGQRGAYSVEMTQSEYEAALEDAKDPNSNLIVIEPVRYGSSPSPSATQLQYLAAQDADSLGLTGAGVTIGIIDTGLNNPGSYNIKASKSFAAGDSNPFNDIEGHGTEMAGLAVPSGAQIAVARRSSEPDAADDEAAAAAYWLADEVGVDVMLHELQIQPSQVLQDAVANAKAKGIIQVGATGNGGVENLGGPGENVALAPALYPGVLAISNYDTATDAIAESSNYGSHTWAAAPGMDGGEDTGTSGASALATNIVARYMTGGRSPGNVVSYLATNARKTGASPLYEGNGVLQLAAAEQDLQQEKPTPTTLVGDVIPGDPILDESGDPVLDDNGDPTFADPVLEGAGSPEPGACG